MNNDFDDLKPAEPVKFPSELPKAGWHAAVCSQVVALGYQKFGAEVSTYPQAAIVFELAAKRQEGDYKGQPFLQTWKGSNVLSKPEAKKKSGLTLLLSGWQGTDMTEQERAAFSLRNVLGMAAFINVKHETGKDGVVRASIASIGPLPEGMTAPAATVKEVPKWLAEMKEKAVQPAVHAAAPDAPPHGEDDLPEFLR